MIRNAFQKQAELRPDSVALIDRGERISFGSLASRKNAIAGYLAGKRRLARGDLVAVALPNCWEFAASFLAVAELGAIFMPFNTHWRARELDAFLPEFPPTLVITSRELREPWTACARSFRRAASSASMTLQCRRSSGRLPRHPRPGSRRKNLRTIPCST